MSTNTHTRTPNLLLLSTKLTPKKLRSNSNHNPWWLPFLTIHTIHKQCLEQEKNTIVLQSIVWSLACLWNWHTGINNLQRLKCKHYGLTRTNHEQTHSSPKCRTVHWSDNSGRDRAFLVPCTLGSYSSSAEDHHKQQQMSLFTTIHKYVCIVCMYCVCI